MAQYQLGPKDDKGFHCQILTNMAGRFRAGTIWLLQVVHLPPEKVTLLIAGVRWPYLSERKHQDPSAANSPLYSTSRSRFPFKGTQNFHGPHAPWSFQWVRTIFFFSSYFLKWAFWFQAILPTYSLLMAPVVAFSGSMSRPCEWSGQIFLSSSHLFCEGINPSLLKMLFNDNISAFLFLFLFFPLNSFDFHVCLISVCVPSHFNLPKFQTMTIINQYTFTECLVSSEHNVKARVGLF